MGDLPTSHEGPHGSAVRVPFPADEPRAAQTVAMWLITAPIWHPFWFQYHLACVRLDDDVPGFEPPRRHFDGATHELIVCALNPESGPYTLDSMEEYARSGGLPYLVPINIAHQVVATDDEMRQLCEMLSWTVVQGILNPETSDAPEQVRSMWLGTIVKSLAHLRGEAHAP